MFMWPEDTRNHILHQTGKSSVTTFLALV